MKTFAVFGNPIAHSKSPRIHQLFAQQCECSLTYTTQLAGVETFEEELTHYFATGAIGANITTPFKERAYKWCTELTERAQQAGAVNTIKALGDGRFLGDNTDGIGLITDLQRLNMLVEGQRVLIIGAGGAARGVIHPLLEHKCKLVITNRTFERAKQLQICFINDGDISASRLDDLSGEHFDLIINATASGLSDDVPQIPISLVNAHTACYDMFYQQNLTPFLQWVKEHGAVHYADGLGMLVGQAAYAFYLWHGVMPDIVATLAQLRKEQA